MSVGALADLSGGLILGPACVGGGHCSMPPPEQYNDYGPSRIAVPDGSGGGNCCNGGGCGGNGGPPPCACCSCGCCECIGCACACGKCGNCGCQTSSAPMPWQIGAGSLDGSGYNHFLSRSASILPDCACCIGLQPPPSTPAPALALTAVPGPGSAYSQVVTVHAANIIPNPPNIADLWITCEQSGVTLWASCSGVSFYHPDNLSKTYTTPEGTALNCTSGTDTTAGSGSASATPPNAVSIGVKVS